VPIEVTTYYLEITDRTQLRPKQVTGRSDLALIEAEIPLPELNRFLYTAVGGDWFWTARIGWSYAAWQQWLAQPGLRTWVLYVAGTPAGYFELLAHTVTDIEIEHFGLIPRFVGEGLGGYLLTQAIETAWAIGGQRVWLHTCTATITPTRSRTIGRGECAYSRKRLSSYELPEQTPGPWPGAR
jgi:GNAT superfamily N-acetyltransferase